MFVALSVALRWVAYGTEAGMDARPMKVGRAVASDMTVKLEQGGSSVATAWQTLEEAALTLGISSRTLHRRLARNEFQTRMENGRREVLVVIPDPTPFPELKLAPDVASTTASARPPNRSSRRSRTRPTRRHARWRTRRTTRLRTDDVGQAMLTLHEDRIRRTDLAIMAYQQSVNVTAGDARRAHVRTKVAWGVAGGLTVLTFVAGIWATHTVTQAQGEVRHLDQVVRQLTDTSDAKSAELERLRKDAADARVAAARAEGQLDAAKATDRAASEVAGRDQRPRRRCLRATRGSRGPARLPRLPRLPPPSPRPPRLQPRSPRCRSTRSSIA